MTVERDQFWRFADRVTYYVSSVDGDTATLVNTRTADVEERAASEITFANGWEKVERVHGWASVDAAMARAAR